jgi:hypothetical protein
VCYERKIFENWNFENRDFWKFSTHSSRFLHFKLRLFDVKKLNRLTFFRNDSSLAERSREASDHLVKKRDLSSEVSWKSRPHSNQLKKPSSFNSAEKAVLIQPSWKSRPYSTQLKKPSSFNQPEKAVLIQLIWKSRSHSPHMRKPSPANPVNPVNPAEKAVSIQPIWKSRPHSIQLKKPFLFNPFEKAVPIQPIKKVSRDVTTHNTEDCESRVLMIERSQR